MGFVFTIIVFVIIGAVTLLGWHSIDLLCQCAPLTEAKAQGTLGIFAVLGFVLGGVLQVLCD